MTDTANLGTERGDLEDVLTASGQILLPSDTTDQSSDTGTVAGSTGEAQSGTSVICPAAPDRIPGTRRPVIARRHNRRLLAVLDCSALCLSFCVGVLTLRSGLGSGTVQRGHLGLWVVSYAPLYLVAFVVYGLYRREHRRLFATNFPDLLHMVHALVVGGAVTVGLSAVVRDLAGLGPAVSVGGAAAITIPALVLVPAVRVGGGALAHRRGLVRSRVIILGSGVVADSVASRLANFDDIELLGCVDDPGGFADGGRGVTSIGLLGPIAELPRLCHELDADRIIVAFSPTTAPELADTLRQLPPAVQISVVPRLFDLLTWRSHVDELHGLPVMDVAPPVLGPAHRLTKRAADLIVASAIVILGSPLWVAIAAAIKLTSAGPVLFHQERRGRGGQPFKICKFRTMRVGAEEEKNGLLDDNDVDGPLFKLKDDPRVTRVGRLLRATSLDEFPQLINVLKGEMSLVGPRPFVTSEADRIDGWAARRFDVRPGMTGLWQVSGRNDLPFEELRRLDYAYVASWSLWWDLKIIWQTPGSVVRRRGAY